MRIKKFLAFVALSFSAFATLYPSSSASALWGGVEVQNYNTYPDPNAKYVLFIHTARGHCTGTVLSRHFALTAAHCRSPHRVFLGNDAKARQGFRVQDSRAIPGSDIRVLLIDPQTPFPFDTYPQLPNEEIVPGSTAYTYGWGDFTKRYLKGGRTKLLGFYNRFGTTGAMINTRQNEPRVCPGDSGGPTYQNGKVVAISSSGVVAKECGNWGGLSSVYKALAGIQEAMQDLAQAQK